MNRFIFFAIIVLLVQTSLLAQTSRRTTSAQRASAAEDGFPDINKMIDSISSGSKDFSLADSIQEMISSMDSDMLTENTEATVRSAIEGQLVVQEVVPEINREVVEAIDTKTRRYSPRLQIDFKEFPLQRLSTARIETESSNALTGVRERIRSRLRTERIDIDFDGRTARLSGVVDSTRQREIAEIMLRLEPGVDTVRNELVLGNKID